MNKIIYFIVPISLLIIILISKSQYTCVRQINQEKNIMRYSKKPFGLMSVSKSKFIPPLVGVVIYDEDTGLIFYSTDTTQNSWVQLVRADTKK